MNNEQDQTIITPGSGNTTLSELYQYKELIYFFTWREIKVRYKQTAIGILWAVLQPLVFMLIIVLLFFRGLGIDFATPGVPVAVSVYAGIMFWNYFEMGLNTASGSLVANQGIITKVYFPRLIPVLSSTIAGLVDLFFSLLVFVGILLVYGVTPTLFGWLMVVPFTIMTFLIIFGTGLWFGTMNVKYRDVKHAIPFLLRLGFFATPVFYPLSFIPERFHSLMYINPMTGVVETMRRAFFNPASIDWSNVSISVATTLAFLVIGIVYYQSKQQEFIDTL